MSPQKSRAFNSKLHPVGKSKGTTRAMMILSVCVFFKSFKAWKFSVDLTFPSQNLDFKKTFLHLNVIAISVQHFICAMVDQFLILGMGKIPPFLGNPYFMGPYKPRSGLWVDELTKRLILMNPMLALLGIEMETIAIVGKCLGGIQILISPKLDV